MGARFTIDEVAIKLGVSLETARGLVRYLVESGDLAQNRGVRLPESGRGRGAIVYSFVDGFEKQLATQLRRAKLTS